jgi:hypothetical protein
MELYQSSVMFGKREQWQELNLKHITSIALSEFDLVQMPCEAFLVLKETRTSWYITTLK